MSSVATAIGAVLADHYPAFDEYGHINGTVPGRGSWDCWCGRIVDATEEQVRAHVADAIAEALGLREETNRYRGIVTSTRPHLRRWVSEWAAYDGPTE